MSNNSHKLLKEYISSLIKEALIQEQEASKKDIFGQWFNPEFREDVPEEANEELNTKAEDEAIYAIEKHLDGNPGLEKWGPKLLDLLKQGKYVPFLAPPQISHAYRIMTVDTTNLEKLLGRKLSKAESDPKKAQHGYKQNGGTYKPRKTASSWTIDSSAFQDIVDSASMVPDQWTVILKAPIKGNNFLFNPETLYAAVNKSSVEHERETVGIGPIKLDNITYVHSGAGPSRYRRLDQVLKHYPKQDF